MTASLRVTPARVALLQAVDEGRVWHYPAGNGSDWPTDRIDNGTRLALIQSFGMYLIERHELATHPPAGTNTGRVRWELTATGRIVLDNAKES